MREEKKLITREYVERLNASPYFIVVNYEGLKVAQFEELRNRLADASAEVHVFKNSIFKTAANESRDRRPWPRADGPTGGRHR